MREKSAHFLNILTAEYQGIQNIWGKIKSVSAEDMKLP